MEKRCYLCRSFEAYYIRGYCCFLKSNCGKCRKLNETVLKHYSCENFKYKQGNLKLKLGIVVNSLETALTNISVLKEFLEESKQ